MIRAAKFSDIPSIVQLMKEGHARSKYANRDEIDVAEAKRLLMQFIQRHGLKREGGTCVFVTDAVDGFMMGMLDRVYHVGTKLVAQDLFYYCRETTPPQSALGLLAAYTDWAESVPNIIEIRNGITDIVNAENVVRVESLYQRQGFSRCGVLMERKVG